MSTVDVARLRALLDEEDRRANAATEAAGGAAWRADDSGIYPLDAADHPGPFLADVYGYTDPGYGEHIAHHDPDRTLRLNAAIRKILNMWVNPDHVRTLTDADGYDGRDPDEVEAQVAEAEAIDRVVRLLAAALTEEG